LKICNRSFFCVKKVRFGNLHNFHTFALLERANVQSHIFKEQKNVRSHTRTFSKSEKMCNHTFLKSGKMCYAHLHIFNKATQKWDCTNALSKWANVQKCAEKCEFQNSTFLHLKKIAQLLFWKRRMCKNVQKKCDFQIALFSLLKKGDCTFSMITLFKVQESAILKFTLFLHILTHLLISKERMCNHTFFALFQRATKSAIAHSNIFKEQKNVRLHICTFSKSKNVWCANVRLPNPGKKHSAAINKDDFLPATLKGFWTPIRIIK